ncbi:AP-4 complex accessory subunit RUSC2 [Girardinichthys multiradiatus]|uniref:AP-4 complex accessory subunit RUSC2 n=1 Tax=Girardinichthys multiradiatus TaxID=208333 RepID=UPI001FADFB7C|nr:AP-4 complex accessory subunit RUSC2 [Girardinichthys multiradiatus]XP_047228092.1 AP-4 complex accessory subunit RUSC2 [Girardinichthys multiradiatus]
MIGASSLSGHTLIACHFPVVQLPTWQLPVQTLCSSAKRPSRLCSSGLTRAVSLPEQDTLAGEHCFTGGRRPFSSSYSSLREDRVEEEGSSDSSGRYNSNSSPEDTGCSTKAESCGAGTTLRLHNSFLPNPELDEEEDDGDSDGDNLHKYCEDSSFVLHGNSNWSLNNGGTDTLLHEDLDSEWINEGLILGLGRDQDWLSNQMDSLQPRCQGCPVSRSGITLLSCLERDSQRLQENIYREHKCSPELLTNIHTEDGSDSSCNSSDGILVNFSTIYNKSNNPATPQDFSSPAADPCQSSEGSVFLNLQPVAQQAQIVEAVPTQSGLDSNCNLYSLEPVAPCLSSLEVTDLAACIQNQDTLAMGTNQKYYKLVTCDLSSHSPSPAWLSLTSCLEGPDRSSSILPSLDSKEEGTSKENMEASDHQVATTSTDVAPCRKQHLQGTQSFCHTPCSLCHSQSSPHSSKYQETGAESTQPSVIQDREYNDADATEMGVWSFDTEVVRHSKLRRPTSLPIQPFVLLSIEKPQFLPQQQHLGSLLEQYQNQKSSKPANSQNSLKFKEKRSQCLSELQSSPMESQCPIFLEAASSSDTCSTCTPSPKCFSSRHMWSQRSQSTSHETSLQAIVESQEKTSLHSGPTNNEPNLVRIPIYQDLTLQSEPNRVTPEPKNTNETSENNAFYSEPSHMLHITPESHDTNMRVSLSPSKTSRPQLKLQQDHHLTAAARLSSLSSFLSSGLCPKQTGEPAGLRPKPTQRQPSQSLILSDRPPTEFCLLLDASYESMSISHLQRKGLLRAVSSAVDLIMAHFGSSRDPEEKMRLGNSSYSPTIAGLVLEHLCPAIQNILEDGLRDHKLDFIIGQRRNQSWTVVEISTGIGPSTKVLYSLVSKIKRSPQLTSHCMRLRAFLMGLLNLRALEFWLSHLQSQKDVVTTYYHPWGFLFMSLSSCQPLFQELLLLLQPLSVLPFDLNLLLEPRLLYDRHLCSEEHNALPPQPCSALLVTSWPKLQADRKVEKIRQNSQTHQREKKFLRSQSLSCFNPDYGAMQTNRSPFLASVPDLLPKKSDFVHSVAKAVNFSIDHRSTLFQTCVDGRKNEREVEKDCGGQNTTTSIQGESPSLSGLRWANLFGAAGTSTKAWKSSQPHNEATKRRLPSQWLHLDRSQIGRLAQSIRSIKLGGAQTGSGC